MTTSTITDREPTRVAGIDLARGVAVLGMLGAHAVGGLQSPASFVLNGHPTILFFLLAGVTVGLTVTRRPTDQPGAFQTRRARLAVRAGTVFLIAVVCAFFPLNAILFQHATLLLLLALLAPVGSRTLRWVAVAVGVVGPVVFVASSGGTFVDTGFVLPTTTPTALIDAAAVAATSITGLLIGRGIASGTLGLGATAVLGGAMLGVGLALRAVGVVAQVFAPTVAPYLDGSAHSSTTAEVLQSTGLGVLVLVACLRAGPRLLRITASVQTIGRMSLTMYVLHFVLLELALPLIHSPADQWIEFGVLAVVLAAVSWTWTRLVGQGPLERVVSSAARIVVPNEPRRRSQGHPTVAA